MTFIALKNEKELLFRLRRNDEEAFEMLYRHYVDPIFRKLLYLVKSVEIAEELAQDVFLKIWEKRGTIDPEKSFRAFIYCIAKNLVTDMYRRLAAERELQDYLIYAVTELHDPLEVYYEEEGNRQLLIDAINKLPAQRKKVIALVKLEGKSYEEVSALLHISTSTIRDHVVKGTKALRAYFTENKIALILIAAAFISESIAPKIF